MENLMNKVCGEKGVRCLEATCRWCSLGPEAHRLFPLVDQNGEIWPELQWIKPRQVIEPFSHLAAAMPIPVPHFAFDRTHGMFFHPFPQAALSPSPFHSPLMPMSPMTPPMFPMPFSSPSMTPEPVRTPGEIAPRHLQTSAVNFVEPVPVQLSPAPAPVLTPVVSHAPLKSTKKSDTTKARWECPVNGCGNSYQCVVLIMHFRFIFLTWT